MGTLKDCGEEKKTLKMATLNFDLCLAVLWIFSASFANAFPGRHYICIYAAIKRCSMVTVSIQESTFVQFTEFLQISILSRLSLIALLASCDNISIV